MLARYTMIRGKRPANNPLPGGLRQDTRKHTGHCLRPTARMVRDYLEDGGSWERFRADYVKEIQARFDADPAPFDRLADLARNQPVYLGCNCPTRKNPIVHHCHTVLALRFMRDHYPDLEVVFPPGE